MAFRRLYPLTGAVSLSLGDMPAEEAITERELAIAERVPSMTDEELVLIASQRRDFNTCILAQTVRDEILLRLFKRLAAC